jgi:hypothetical protein
MKVIVILASERASSISGCGFHSLGVPSLVITSLGLSDPINLCLVPTLFFVHYFSSFHFSSSLYLRIAVEAA